MIALFRASNIPARYAYGTVRIPADKVMNWVGGVDVPEAAQQLLGQGGIPNRGLRSEGVIKHIEIEHVWVEAWVDYFPSRAAKHKVGDNWIPLDASFKQYDFTEAQDIDNSVPFDAQGLVDEVYQTATIDESAGFVQGVDPAIIEAAYENYQQQIQAYIDSQDPDTTIGEVLGTQKVIIQNHRELASGLPYKLVVRSNNYSVLPDSLRHKFRYTLSTEVSGQEGNRLITFEHTLPELAGKRLSLSFRPSTSADEELLMSYLPSSTDSSISGFPRTLPGYLINYTAEFKNEDRLLLSAPSGAMGSELYETLSIWSPTFGWDQAINHPVVGEYRSIGLDLQGISSAQADSVKGQLQFILDAITKDEPTRVSNLTKENFIGPLLHTAILTYFALNDIQDQIQSRVAEVVRYRLPSFGIFSVNVSPTTPSRSTNLRLT